MTLAMSGLGFFGCPVVVCFVVTVVMSVSCPGFVVLAVADVADVGAVLECG